MDTSRTGLAEARSLMRRERASCAQRATAWRPATSGEAVLPWPEGEHLKNSGPPTDADENMLPRPLAPPPLQTGHRPAHDINIAPKVNRCTVRAGTESVLGQKLPED
jgi:hypothetical protein